MGDHEQPNVDASTNLVTLLFWFQSLWTCLAESWLYPLYDREIVG